MRTRIKSRWILVATILLAVIVPAIATTVLVRLPHRKEAPDRPSPGYLIEAPLQAVGTAGLEFDLATTADLPEPASCGELLEWTDSQGNAAVNIGRVDLTVKTRTSIQVVVKSINVEVTGVRKATAKTLVSCSTSDWRERWDPKPGSDNFQETLAIHDEDYFTEVPYIALGDPGRKAQPVSYDTPPESLRNKLLSVHKGDSVHLPFYVGAGSGADQAVVFDVHVRLTVNGLPVDRTVRGLSLQRRHLSPQRTEFHEWLTDKQRWVSARQLSKDRAAPRPREGSPVCELLNDFDLEPMLGSGLVANSPVHDACIWSGPEPGRSIELYRVTHRTVELARADYLRQADNFADVEGVRSESIRGIGDEAVFLSSGIVISRKQADVFSLSLSEVRPDTQSLIALLSLAVSNSDDRSVEDVNLANKFVGEWWVHGMGIHFGADGTGHMSWNEGPCEYDFDVMCTGRGRLVWRLAGDRLIYTITALRLEDESGTPQPYDEGRLEDLIGISHAVRHVAPGLLEQHSGDPDTEEGNPYLCGNDIRDIDKYKCGA